MDSNVIKQQLRVFRIITLTAVLIAGLSFAGLVTSFMFRPQPLTILLPHHISAPYQMSYSSANRTYLPVLKIMAVFNALPDTQKDRERRK